MEEIGDYMASPVLKINVQDSVQEAAVMMEANHIGSLIVEDLGNDVGIITERDLSQKVIAQKKDPASLKAGDIMTSPILTMDRFLPIEEANNYMRENRVRHLGVTEEDRIIGIISVQDLVGYFSQGFRMQE